MSLPDGTVLFSMPDPVPSPTKENLDEIFSKLAAQQHRQPVLVMSQKTFDQMVEFGLILKTDDKSGKITESIPGLPGAGPSCPLGTNVLVCMDPRLTSHIPVPIQLPDISIKMIKPRRLRGTKFRS